jgi:IS30 family transposase
MGYAGGMKPQGRPGLSHQQKAELWRRWKSGETLSDISRALAKNPGSIHGILESNGGVVPRTKRRAKSALSAAQREEISRSLAKGRTQQAIARRIGCADSTVSREIQRNGGCARYRAERAEYRASQMAKRPKPCLLSNNHRLRQVVAKKLALKWSPEQISGWLERAYPSDPVMRISHETIYRSLFIQARGVLRKALIRELRTHRTMRCAKVSSSKRFSSRDAFSISKRPASVEDRAISGHWEGDLLSGSNNTHIATLVEQSSRYLVLVKVESKETEQVISAITKQVKRLPQGLMSTLTWDRGAELADHERFSVATDVSVYFCDPSSPWQRGTNENTNGLLRQYMPRRTNLSGYSQRDLNKIAKEMNARPRKTLDYISPAEFLAEKFALTG